MVVGVYGDSGFFFKVTPLAEPLFLALVSAKRDVFYRPFAVNVVDLGRFLQIRLSANRANMLILSARLAGRLVEYLYFIVVMLAGCRRNLGFLRAALGTQPHILPVCNTRRRSLNRPFAERMCLFIQPNICRITAAGANTAFFSVFGARGLGNYRPVAKLPLAALGANTSLRFLLPFIRSAKQTARRKGKQKTCRQNE